MKGAPAGVAERMRGIAAGLLTAALAVASHGLASGGAPSGAAVVLLAALAGTVGALAATIVRATDTRVLLGLLTAGQVIGHLMLSLAGHGHGAPLVPAPAMWAAHILAVAVGATLIAAGDRLCRAMLRAVEAVGTVLVAPIPARALLVSSADQPMRSALLLAASVSHRGPPVSRAR